MEDEPAITRLSREEEDTGEGREMEPRESRLWRRFTEASSLSFSSVIH